MSEVKSEDKAPKTPAPRITTSGGVDRLIPAAEFLDIHPKDLTRYQADALECLDDVRRRVLAGEVLGVAVAAVSVIEGDQAISTSWSSGFMGFGIHGSAAIAQLNFRFQSNFHYGSQ